MSLLQNLTQTHEGTDMTELPYDLMNDIQNNIRKGAADLEQDWANALHLVHKAYQAESVERPDPSMTGAWKQYETNIQYAVQMLAKYRTLDADWRMSSALVHEAMERKVMFRVTSEGSKSAEHFTTKAKNIDDVIKTIEDRNEELLDVGVKKSADGHSATLTFSKWGVKKNYRLRIEPIIK